MTRVWQCTYKGKRYGNPVGFAKMVELRHVLSNVTWREVIGK